MKILGRFDDKILEEAPPLEVRREVKGAYSTDILPKLEHINARSIEEAVFLLKTYEDRAALIAGGQLRQFAVLGAQAQQGLLDPARVGDGMPRDDQGAVEEIRRKLLHALRSAQGHLLRG